MNVLFFGPLPPMYHGQSVAFQKAIEINSDKKIIININLTGKSNLKKIISNLFILIYLLYVFLLKTKVDVVYFTCSRTILGSIKDVVLLQLAGLFNVPVVNHLHGADFKEFINNAPRLYRAILINSYSNVSHSIVLIDAMRDQFDMFPDMKVSVVRNFFIQDSALKKKVNPKAENVSFIFISNIMKSKGIFILFEAYMILKRKYPRIELRIAGTAVGDYELNATNTWTLFNNYLKFSNDVNYFGLVLSDLKYKLLSSSSVFVLPSFYKSEAIPLSIIEAMAAGCAIITTNHNYLPCLVGCENGLLARPNNTASLVEAMERYILSPDLLKMHQLNNIGYAATNFSEEAYLSGIERVIEQALKVPR